MAPPLNAPVAGEIWHLSIEDLFQPVQEAPRLGGKGPFVINLSVSTAPIALPVKPFTSRQDAHVYQIQVMEDGRTRFRLRLGPFKSEDEADAILAEVRDTYPGALTATASGSDLRVIESMEAKANQRQASQKAQATPKAQVSPKAAADKAAIESFVSPKAAAAAAPKSATPEKAPLNIIEAAVQLEIAKVEAEISIDLAWPIPELKLPTPAPLRVEAAAPLVQVVASPAAIAKPVPAAAVIESSLAKPIAEPAPVPSAGLEAKTPWVLPELDIPFPAAQRAAAPTIPVTPVAAEPATPQPKPFELQIAPPLSLVGDAPLLTEVVMPKKAPAKTVAQKPAVAAPVLTEVVIPKAKISKAAVAAPPGTTAAHVAVPAPVIPSAPVTLPAPVAVPGPLAVSAPAPIAAKPAAHAAAPVTVAPASRAPVVAAPVVAAPAAVTPVMVTSIPPKLVVETASAPVAAALPPAVPTPISSPLVSASVSTSATGTVKTLVKPPAAPFVGTTAPQSIAAPPPMKPLPVIPQSLVMPRRGVAPKPAKPMPSKLKSLQHVVVATAPAPAPREVKKLEQPLPDLESTQTIRALTPKELEENDRWFVIQLALADHAFDPEAVPNLDIFGEYRLYSVAGLDQGRVVHALRLGFFKEEIGAVAVASYLAAYWDKPTIKRVSVAERERFADQRVDARKDVGATGRHSVIEITDELVARRRHATKAPVTEKAPNRTAEY
jgi:SPOR domain